jgi:hypothetical protein
MSATWKDVRCASIRAQDLPALADLRRHAEIRLKISQGRAWIYWEHESEEMRRILLRRILPLPGVQLFRQQGGNWYRLGDHLPTFDTPDDEFEESVPLHRLLLPATIVGCRPDVIREDRVLIRAARDERGRSQPAVALRCPLAALWEWVERATSAQLAGLQAAWTGGTQGRDADATVLVLGTARALPLLSAGQRFWGNDLLIPLGSRAEPDLPEPALRLACGAGPDDLIVLDQEGFELIPRGVFQRIERAGVCLAWRRARSGRPDGGSRR